MILDGIGLPLLVLLTPAALLAGRSALWARREGESAAYPRWTDAAIVGLVIVLSGWLLVAMGRPLTYRQGPMRLWSGDVGSDQNSQQLADPYTLTHVTHGILLYGLVGLTRGAIGPRTRVVVALALECAWEVLENTDAVVQRYRTATIAQGYFGDSVLNSLGDILAAAAGCVLAMWVPVRLLAVGIVALEGLLALWIRDNLTLNVLMLLRPIAAIQRWQLGG